MTMSDRKRILALLQGGTPDRVPWLGDLTWWAWGMELRGEVPSGWQSTEAYYHFHRDLNVGFYLQGYEPSRTAYDETIRFSDEKRGNVRRHTIHTPVGDLSEEWTYLAESYAEAPTTRLLKSLNDLPVLRYVFEHTRYEPDYEEARRRYGMIGDLGLVLCYLPKSPLMQMVALLAGIQQVVDLAVDAKRELEATLEVMEWKADEAAAVALASPAECLMIPENLSAEVIGPRFFDRHMRGYEQKWTERIRRAGKHSFIHMDGTLRGLIDRVSQAGFTVIEAVTPTPVGDLSFSQMRDLAGPDTILWGGVPGVYFTALIDDGEFERLVRDVLSAMTTAPRYVLGVADQVPPNALRRRVAQVAELVERYGGYR